MFIRPATLTDLSALMHIYDSARQFMQNSGNSTQWIDGYPSITQISNDIKRRHSYAIEAEGKIVGAFYFAVEDEPNYTHIEQGKWLNQEPYGVIHRVASDGSQKGIASFCFDWCFRHHPNLRIDTHADNRPMQRVIREQGFVECGVIRLANGDPRLAFQKTDFAADNQHHQDKMEEETEIE